jgi:DNA-binding LytR/AlgR family response regulator
VRENGRYLIVRNEQVDWIEADGRDCVLHCGSQAHRVDGPLTELAERLCADRFVQVSRSSLLNIDSIAQLQEMFKGDLVAVMKGGQEVPVSRRFRTQVMDRLAG